MNPANATALYVSASRAVLQCDPKQPSTFTDMYNILPFFRHTLACVVCGKYGKISQISQSFDFHDRSRFNGGVCVT